jgi:hypothetical protein
LSDDVLQRRMAPTRTFWVRLGNRGQAGKEHRRLKPRHGLHWRGELGRVRWVVEQQEALSISDITPGGWTAPPLTIQHVSTSTRPLCVLSMWDSLGSQGQGAIPLRLAHENTKTKVNKRPTNQPFETRRILNSEKHKSCKAFLAPVCPPPRMQSANANATS